MQCLILPNSVLPVVMVFYDIYKLILNQIALLKDLHYRVMVAFIFQNPYLALLYKDYTSSYTVWFLHYSFRLNNPLKRCMLKTVLRVSNG